MAIRAALARRASALLARPGDALARLAADVVVTAAGVLMILAVFDHTEHVAGWTAGEVLMAWGLAQGALGLTRAVFGGLWVLNRRYLLGGELDALLLRPLGPYTQVLIGHVEPGALALTAGALGVFAVGAARQGVALGPGNLVAAAVFVVGGTLLLAGVLTATASVGFFTAHRGSAVGLVTGLVGLAHVPPEALPRLWAWALTTVLPLAFTGVVPAAWFSGRAPWAELALLQPLIGLVAFAGGFAVWRVGLARYGSSGR